MSDENVTISMLKQRALRFRDARRWRQFHNPKDLVLALVAEAGERFVHRVIHDLPNEVVQTARGSIANIHSRAFANGFQSFEDLDTSFAIGVAALGDGTPFIVQASMAIGMILGSCHCVFTLTVNPLALDCRTQSTLALNAHP